MTKEKMTYDSAYAELKKILSSLENDEIGIDKLSDNVKRALTIIQYCKGKLKSTESEVGKILEE